LRGKFCSGTKVLKTIISTTIFDMKGIKLKTTKVKSLVVIRIFVGEIAQNWECENCQYANCESQSIESKVKRNTFELIFDFADGEAISGNTNNNSSKDKSGDCGWW
jgi:hypothetical protein